MVDHRGLELRTNWLRVSCSTYWANDPLWKDSLLCPCVFVKKRIVFAFLIRIELGHLSPAWEKRQVFSCKSFFSLLMKPCLFSACQTGNQTGSQGQITINPSFFFPFPPHPSSLKAFPKKHVPFFGVFVYTLSFRYPNSADQQRILFVGRLLLTEERPHMDWIARRKEACNFDKKNTFMLFRSCLCASPHEKRGRRSESWPHVSFDRKMGLRRAGYEKYRFPSCAGSQQQRRH